METSIIIHFAAALFAVMNPLGNLPLDVSATITAGPETASPAG